MPDLKKYLTFDEHHPMWGIPLDDLKKEFPGLKTRELCFLAFLRYEMVVKNRYSDDMQPICRERSEANSTTDSPEVTQVTAG